MVGENKKIDLKFIIFIIVSIIAIVLMYHQGVFTPYGVIVAEKGDDSSSRLGEYSYRVIATILNEGRAGDITLTVDLKQGGKFWRKKETKYIEKEGATEFVVEFDEATLLGGNAYYSLSCSP